ncbi:hypothetical protein [Paenibacillus sp. YN15]|uniref:hypothetical protein n=1 Tax=Paenibacillus sp. YN15 TaxID=1742774 RepID=UPI000DCCA156|nr:hypothetical protein [Paenibacillus sp. YN15]RAV02379.1 hypothetical protein DQG13_10155 [Paenibacillus sp. YN15]
MPILIQQHTDSHFSIQSPEELMTVLAEFLKAQDQVKISLAVIRALAPSGAAKASGVASPEHCGYIEGQLESAASQLSSLVEKIAEQFQLTIESGSENVTSWTLYSREEADYNDHFGL